MSKKKGIITALMCGNVVGCAFMAGFHYTYAKTSTNEYCMSCHVHTQADDSWK